MHRKRNGKSGAQNRRNKSMALGELISHPPQIPRFEVRHSTRLRFVSTAAIDLGITFQNLLDTILMATTAVQVADLFYAVRVKAVEVWANPAVGTTQTVSVIYAGVSTGAIGDQSTHTDTSMGIQPAHVRAVPVARSLAANFQSSSSDLAFILQCPSASVVDVELSFTGAFNSSVIAQHAAVGAAPGAVLLRGLDGVATAGTQIPTALTQFAI
jgi:hypothetical protein